MAPAVDQNTALIGELERLSTVVNRTKILIAPRECMLLVEPFRYPQEGLIRFYASSLN
jgi:hypothetical protein